MLYTCGERVCKFELQSILQWRSCCYAHNGTQARSTYVPKEYLLHFIITYLCHALKNKHFRFAQKKKTTKIARTGFLYLQNAWVSDLPCKPCPVLHAL